MSELDDLLEQLKADLRAELQGVADRLLEKYKEALLQLVLSRLLP